MQGVDLFRDPEITPDTRKSPHPSQAEFFWGTIFGREKLLGRATLQASTLQRCKLTAGPFSLPHKRNGFAEAAFLIAT